MNHYLAIAIGGGLGSVARFWLASSVHRLFKVAFPYGTLAVNVLGCFLLGGIVGLIEQRGMFSPSQRTFLTVGILGGFTTFSTFGFETFALLREQQYLAAFGNVAANVLLGLLAVIAGWFLTRFA